MPLTAPRRSTSGWWARTGPAPPQCPEYGRSTTGARLPATSAQTLQQISGLTARVDELVMQNKALLARIAELEAEHGKPPKTPDNSSLPPSRGQKGNVAEPTSVIRKSRRSSLVSALASSANRCRF